MTKLNYFGKEINVSIIGKSVNYIASRKWTNGKCDCISSGIVDLIVENSMGLSLYAHGNNVGFIKYFHIA